MTNRILPIIAALTFATASAFAAPEPGGYVGVLTVSKYVAPAEGGLFSTYTLKANARVFGDGRIAILPAIPESPSAAVNPESTLIRAVPIAPQQIPVGWGPIPINPKLRGPLFPNGPRSGPLTFDLRVTGIRPVVIANPPPVYTHLVESQYPAFVTTEGTLLKILYTTNRLNEANTIDPNISYTAFSFVFRQQSRGVHPPSPR